MTRFFSLLRGTPWVAALLLAGWLTPRAANASHALGADMSYLSVSPGFYLVQVRFYRDCSGTPAVPANFTLSYEATGCGANNTANGGGSLTLQQRGFVQGNPYCPIQNAQSPCDPNGPVVSSLPNYQICTYSGLLNLSGGPGYECTDWVLGISEQSRPGTRNLVGQDGLYTETHLNNKLVTDDSSPAFSTAGGLQPLAVMYDTTLVRYNSSVIDPDGDSLVYSMVRPLSGPGTPVAYANGHSLQYPIRLKAGTPPVHLDQQGTLEFVPGRTMAGSPNDEDNKFTFVIQVEAYRRINGVARKICTVRRDIAGVIVHASSFNPAPVLPDSSVTVLYPTYAQTIGTGDTIYSYVGEPLLIDASFFDSGDSIYVEMPTGLSPAGSSMVPVNRVQATGFSRLTARISWTPTAADVRSQAHPFFLRVRDNGCPGASSAYYPLSVMVAALRPVGLPAGARMRQPLRASPNPFVGTTRLSVPAAARAASVGIYDLTGRLIDRLLVPPAARATDLTWHAPAALPAGVYVARYQGAAGQQTVRLVKE